MQADLHYSGFVTVSSPLDSKHWEGDRKMIYSPFSFCLICCSVCCAAPPAMLLCGSDSSSCFAGTVFPPSWNSWLSEIFAKWAEAEPCFTDRQRPQAEMWRIWEKEESQRLNFLGVLSQSKGEKLTKEPLHQGMRSPDWTITSKRSWSCKRLLKTCQISTGEEEETLWDRYKSKWFSK